MPPSIEKGQQGTNTIEFRVLQDGSVPKDSLRVVEHSGKSDFDAASLQGVREVMPFNPFTRTVLEAIHRAEIRILLPRSYSSKSVAQQSKTRAVRE
jgi:TonB family protein